MSPLPINEFVISGFCFSAILFGIAACLLYILYIFRWQSDLVSYFVWLIGYALAGLLTLELTKASSTTLLATMGFNLLLFLCMLNLIQVISVFGLFFLISLIAPSFYSLIWFIELIYTSTQYLNFLPFLGIIIVALPICFLLIINTSLWSWIALTRFSQLYFRFPRLNVGWEIAKAKQKTPKVSLHIPCYAEPPEIVIETLNALAQLDYPFFEVIVLDNNTKEHHLWKPVAEHCTKLGERFHFVHVDHLKGAKAGALNLALQLTAPDADIIGVIDADFMTQPNFLEKLVGFFDDPQIGFIQTCQDYRHWKMSRFLSSCYFEYSPAFRLEMPARNEWDVNYTVGTMCLFRKTALNDCRRLG